MKPLNNISYYLITIALFIVLKFLFSFAKVEHLAFLLYPTNFLVELVMGSSSIFQEGEGYLFREINIIIDKSCSGYNYWLLSFTMLAFLAFQHTKDNRSKISVLLLSFFTAYCLTILVNGSRILTTIFFSGFSVTRNPLVHESIGIINNLTFLILTYLIAERLFLKHNSNEKLAES